MKKISQIILYMFLLMSGASFAGEQAVNKTPENPLACIYKLKESASSENKICVDKLMTIFEQERTEQQFYTFLGHLVAVLNHYPEYEEQIFSKKLSAVGHKVVLRAIMLSDTATKAQDYVSKYNLSKDYEALVAQAIVPLSKWPFPSGAFDNDILINAAMVSKETKYLDILFKVFSIPPKDVLEDCIRLGFIASKFGMDTTKSPLFTDEHRPNIAKNLCNKHDCQSEPKQFMFMMQISSAFWAMNSLASQQELFKNSYEKFLNENKDLQEIMLKERVSFSNYLTSLMLYKVFEKQRDNKNVNIENTLKFMEKYENFEDVSKVSLKDIGIEKTVKQ